MDSVTKAMHCKAKHANNLQCDLSLLHARDHILALNLPISWILVCAVENRLFPLEYSIYKVSYRTEVLNVHFSQTCQKQCSSKNGFVNTYYMFNKTTLDNLKAYHQI